MLGAFVILKRECQSNLTTITYLNYYIHTSPAPASPCLPPQLYSNMFLRHLLAPILLLSHVYPLSFHAPHFPTYFTADVNIVSHLITPELQTDGYPPSTRSLHLTYDRDRGTARIDEGIITYLRRFDLKKEFKLNSGPYPSCRTSYLSESLPTHQFARGGSWSNHNANTPVPCPSSSTYHQQMCREWQQDEGGGQIVKVFVAFDTWLPLIATLHATNPMTMQLEPTLTFEWTNIQLDRPDPTLFVDVSTTRKDCKDQAGGFPWIHLFHHFFRV